MISGIIKKERAKGKMPPHPYLGGQPLIEKRKYGT